MRRSLLISILAGVLLVLGTGFSYASLFDSLQTYGTGGSGITMNDNNNNPGYSNVVSQTVTFDPLLESFGSAYVDVTYSGILGATNQELWYALASNIQGPPSGFSQLGQLIGHGNSTQTQSFDLSSLEPSVPPGGLQDWTLYFAFRENTNTNDIFTLYSTRVYGDYTPVPIPATALLFGSALLCLVGIRMRRKDG